MARLEAIDTILEDAEPYDVLMVCAHVLAQVMPLCCEAHEDEFKMEFLQILSNCVDRERDVADAADAEGDGGAPRKCTEVAAMDGKETSERSSGLCTGNGATAPPGARVSQLIWSRAGLSGAMAWDLISGGKAARPGILRGRDGAQTMTDRPTFAELVGDVRRGFGRAQEHMVRLEKRFDAVDAELAACRAALAASTARIIGTIAAPWRVNVYTITLERISTGERAGSMLTRQASEAAARCGRPLVVAVEARQ